MENSQNKPLVAIAHFPPVALRPRWSGWTPDKQIAFVEALSETVCVTEACRVVGMSAASAYALRRRPSARHFREAWDAALDMGVHRLEQAALGQALNGVPRPIFYRGEQVGEAREYDERLTMFLLRYRRATRFGPQLDHPGPPPPPEPGDSEWTEGPDDPATRLDWHCEEIAALDPAVFEDRGAEDAREDFPRANALPSEEA
jgi:hypothetical protein